MNPRLVLVLNCGSSSLKFALINTHTQQQIVSGLGDALGSDSPVLTWKMDGEKHARSLAAGDNHAPAIAALVSMLKEHGFDQQLVAVGHRVVHGAEKFSNSVVINDQVLEQIHQAAKLAPLHNPANIIGIEAAQNAFNGLPQVAVFDTAFHQSIPERAYLYALPRSLHRDQGIRRYGFHGTSHYFVSRQAAGILNRPVGELNLITAHLGNGASVTAIKQGKSVDTSMGLTPLEGLVMGTRCGDLDPAIIQFLVDQLGYSQQQVNTMLNKESGLLGISELSNDCRAIEEAAAEGHEGAQLALEIFCYRLAKYIASYTVPLGSLDALIFTGGIGENSSTIRARVLELLTIFGFTLDDQANLDARFGNQGIISGATGPTAMVIPTDEELVIAQDAIKLIQSA